MSQTSPTLQLPLVQPAQAQKHVTVNEALLRLDALVQCTVESRSVTAQPALPESGQVWIIPDGASGADWAAANPGDLAVFRDGSWTMITPQPGWQVHVRDEAASLFRDGSATRWRAGAAVQVVAEGETGAATRAWLGETVIEGLNGASAVTDLVIPARAIVFCVSVTTREAITGAAAYDCGIAGETSKFGGSLGVSVGASNIGVIGPTAFYSDTPIVLTASGGDFTGGSVALAIHAWCPTAPDA